MPCCLSRTVEKSLEQIVSDFADEATAAIVGPYYGPMVST